VFEECVTCKAGWELRKSCIGNKTEKFLEKFFFKIDSSSPEEKKQHSKFLRI